MRLRPGRASPTKKPRSRAAVAGVTAPDLPPPPPGDFILDGSTDFSMLSVHESSAPVAVAEMQAYSEPPPSPVTWPWWLFAGVALLAASTIIAMVALIFG